MDAGEKYKPWSLVVKDDKYGTELLVVEENQSEYLTVICGCIADHGEGYKLAAAQELLAYAECEEAKRLSLLPTDKGGTGNSQSYFDTFNKHGWDGRDVHGFLDRLRSAAIAKATGAA